MRTKSTVAYLSLASVLAVLMSVGAPAKAASLGGQVSSTEEGAMEGVLVSAKKEGSTITTTVVTNDKGQFSFPDGKLEPGTTTSPSAPRATFSTGPKTVDVAGGRRDGRPQARARPRTSSASSPMPNGSTACRATTRSSRSCPIASAATRCSASSPRRTRADEWKQVFTRMGRYAPESVPTRPQLLVPGGARSERPRVPADMMKQAAEFLASVSLSNPDREEYDFKTLPRPKGRATKVIITEYDLPRKEALPHDVVVDPDGHAWYSDFGNQIVGELDPKTGKVQDYRAAIAARRTSRRARSTSSSIPTAISGSACRTRAALRKIDRKTKAGHGLSAARRNGRASPRQTNMVTPTHMNVDGKVWMTDTENGHVYRLDIKTGKWENMGEATDADGKTIRGYGMPTDKDNNVYMMSFGDTRIGRLDAKTNVAKIWTTPIVRSRPRRGRVDDQNRLWFAEYGGNSIAHVRSRDRASSRSGSCRRRGARPTTSSLTKDATEVWTGSMLTDQVARLDPKTDEIVEYLLPHSTNIRRVFVDESGPRPVLWVGNNHGAAIVRVEPLD